MERRILSAILSSRGAYEQVKDILGDQISSTFSPTAQIVAKCIEDYYTRDGSAQNCPREVLLERIEAETSGSKIAKAVQDFASGLEGSVSVPNLLYDIRLQRKHRIGDKLAGLLANRSEEAEVSELIDAWQLLNGDSNEQSESDEGIYRGVGVGALLDKHFSSEGTIPFGFERLNKSCDGGARRGHHILIYARPEIGKSLLTIDLVCGWLESGYTVLYGGNEDPMSDITLRVIGRLSRRTRDEIRNDPEGTQRICDSRGYENFVGVNLSPGTFGEIRKLCDVFTPDIVVIDQLRNIDTGDDNRVTSLEKAAIGARNLAKSRGVLVVSITQAGDSAEGKPFLDLSDIDFSKTGIPGAVDLAVGIGATDEYKRTGIRGISLPKNKLSGSHDTFLARFNTRTGEVLSVANEDVFDRRSK